MWAIFKSKKKTETKICARMKIDSDSTLHHPIRPVLWLIYLHNIWDEIVIYTASDWSIEQSIPTF